MIIASVAFKNPYTVGNWHLAEYGILMFALLYLAVRYLQTKRPVVVPALPWVAMLLLVSTEITCLRALIDGKYVEESNVFNVLGWLLVGFIIYLLIPNIANTYRKLLIAFGTVILTGILQSVAGFWIVAREGLEFFVPITNRPALALGFHNANYQAAWFVLSLLYTIGVVILIKGRIWRWMFLAGAMIIGIGLALTFSRGAILAIALGLTVQVLWSIRKAGIKKLWKDLAILIIVGFSVYLVVNNINIPMKGYETSSWEFLRYRFHPEVWSADQDRFLRWSQGLKAFMARPWGWGLSGVYAVVEGGSVHNLFGEIALECGLIGLALFCGLLYFLFSKSSRLGRATVLPMVAISGAIGVLTHGLTLDLFNERILWLTLGLLGSTLVVERNMKSIPRKKRGVK